MKAEDLMLGNWVGVEVQVDDTGKEPVFKKFPKRVKYLEHGIIGLEDDAQFGAEITPYPITKEVLEENGFACIEIGDNGPSTPKQNVNRYEKWQVRTQWHTIDIFYDRLKKKWRLNGKDIEFVHELQQEYKRSKIEEEVQL